MTTENEARRAFEAMGIPTPDELEVYLAEIAEELGLEDVAFVPITNLPAPLSDAEIDAALIAGLRETFRP